jgi:preprotein translocase subunit YajC
MFEQLVSAVITPAHAQTTAPAGGEQQGGGMSLALMFLLFILFVYFAIWRPQNKREREMRSLLGGLAKGDEVVTAGGIVGRITKISDKFITLAVGSNVEMLMQRSAVGSVLPKGTIKSVE